MDDNFDPYYEWLGIAPHQRPLNHYLLLGLEVREGDPKRISNAADQRVAYLRSMQQGKRGELSQQLLNEVAAAASCLLNPDAKQAYDASLPAEAEAAPPTATPLPVSALTGPMAPVAASIPEPTAPPVTSSSPEPSPAPAVPYAAAPPVLTGEPVAPPKVGGEQEPFDEEPVMTPRTGLFIAVFFGIAIMTLLATAVLIGGVVFTRLAVEPAAVPPPPAEVEDDPVEVVEEPAIDEPVVVTQEADGGLRLSPSFAQLSEGLELSEVKKQVIVADWSLAEQQVQWRIRLVKPGVFRAKLVYSTSSDAPVGRLRVEAAGKSQMISLRGSGGPKQFVSETFFLAIPKFGVSSLTLQPESFADNSSISLKSLELLPE